MVNCDAQPALSGEGDYRVLLGGILPETDSSVSLIVVSPPLFLLMPPPLQDPIMAAVFVYGTLKRGGLYQEEWMRGQTFLHVAETADPFRLFSTGEYPVMVRDKDGYRVKGEVWKVDGPGLARLDVLEGVAEQEYTRVRIPLRGQTAQVWAYLYLGSIADLPECGPEWPVT